MNHNSSSQTWRLIIRGVVQSVGFRPTVARVATYLNLVGTVRNLGNEGVEIILNTDLSGVNNFIKELEKQLPELAEIFYINKKQVEHQVFDTFQIIQSKSGSVSHSGISPLPPDIPICQACQEEILGSGKRSDYAFTSCTDCGPRYSVIEALPYDRERTSFADFPLCDTCLQEYQDPEDRRYHAQTTCCPTCGPAYQVYDVIDNMVSLKEKTSRHDQLDFIASEIDQGSIIALQGLGGTHYIVDAFARSSSTLRQRKRKKSDKPFAVMMPSLDIVKKYCRTTSETEDLLLSQRRPIVLLPIRNKFRSKFDNVSPKLHTLGVMLPYTGIHHLLFDRISSEVLVMTSANPPKIPMPINPDDIIKQTKTIANLIVVHNRKIIQRIDDSVIRSYDKLPCKLLRRARGYTPTPVFLESVTTDVSILGLGAEQVNTASLLYNDYLVMTQYIGDIVTVEALEFQREAIDHLMQLYQQQPKIIVLDLHPQFLTRSEISRYSSETTIITELQHHAAHAYSLLADVNADPNASYLIWSCDGYGYGSDGQAWGGELLLLEHDHWERLGSLLPVKYPGGDRNAKYPDRMLAIMLHRIGIEPSSYFVDNLSNFEYSKTELETLVRQLDSNQLVTSSVGRLLDAIAALLDINHERTFRGEPAIKLEDVALQTEGTINASEFVNGTHVDSIRLFEEAYKLKQLGEKTAEIANWVLRSLGKSMGRIAIDLNLSVNGIGFTGGVAYNEIIEQSIRDIVEEYNLPFLAHERIPPGDGGISAGQVFYAALKYSNDNKE